jgi:undecaprenyl pyrophosphate phosphatase UppP
MITSLFNRIVLGVLRHLLTAMAGVLLARGVITHSQDDQVVGSALVVSGIMLSAAEKMKTQTAVKSFGSAGNAQAVTTPKPPDFTGHAGGSGGQGKT